MAAAAAASSSGAGAQPSLIFGKEVNPMNLYRDIGNEAVWSLSTAKPGNGVEELRDNNIETYWQSDGGQPHLINIQFHKKMSITEIAFYLDYSLDESYTPKKISIRSGTTFHDLVEVRVVDLHEPSGWVTIPLQNKDAATLRAFFLQVCVVSMHQNGRDTHVRQAKIFGPRTPIDTCDPNGPQFTTTQMTRFSVLR
ncbi:hypothetical protein CTAYLR_001218 [Chrysophaeum taylorii]|uniref:Anaphase-promoting complex subunit 10 n=1 Tax=Chrysophaeum taylorii TaxID=2483200 RepID=A0AAD7XLB8_9STRA|nr:hypothetical protein CTAYLR_001218 [Chrysophaeum taylorii]